MTPPAILIYVEDPGAALYLRGLPGALADAGFKPVVVSTDHARGTMAGARDLPPGPRGDDMAIALLAEVQPGVLVVGTSEDPDSFAFRLASMARGQGLPVIGAVDSAANADRRFAGRTVSPLAHAPDALLVPDPASARAFAALGFPASAIHVTGHPRIDEVRAMRAKADDRAREDLRRHLFPAAPPDHRIAIFVSELSVGLGGTAPFSRSPAYTLAGTSGSDRRSDIVAEEAVRALNRLDRIWTVLRLHPKQVALGETASTVAFDQVSQSEPALDLCLAADLVCGMTSVLLVEAAALGVPVLSIVPKAAERAWLGDAGEAIPSVSTRAALEAWLAGPWTPAALDLPPPGTALNRMVAAIGRLTRKASV